jgi:acylglycerol lipase
MKIEFLRAATLLSLCVTATVAIGPGSARESRAEKADQAAMRSENGRGDNKPSTDRVIGGDVPLKSWTDQSVEPWAALLCIHGLGLHKEDFEPLGKKMAALGVATYAIDVRGFGSWMKTAEHRKVDFEQTMKDVESSLRAIRMAHPDLPLVILGESMGGAIALQSASLYPELVDGLVSCVPSGDRFGNKKASFKVAVALMKSPNKPMKMGDKIVEQASQDEELRENWSDDPNSRMQLSARELFQFQMFMNQNSVRAKAITETPTLIVQGANDHLVKPGSTIELFNQIATPHKDLLLIGSSEHLIFEKGQFNDHVIDVLSSWIDHNAGSEDATAAMEAKKPVTDAKKPATDAFEKHEVAQENANKTTREAMAHLSLGRGYLLLENFQKAGDEFKIVLKLARGTAVGREADGLMLSLPGDVMAPHVGPSTRATPEELKLMSVSGAMANDKPSVLFFCAPWVDTCASLKQSIAEVMSPFQDKINFVEIDADSPANQSLLHKYGINPLPAVLFLNGQNEVVSYVLGNDLGALRSGLAKIVDAHPVAKLTPPPKTTSPAKTTVPLKGK